jgi:predicted metal-binding protein
MRREANAVEPFSQASGQNCPVLMTCVGSVANSRGLFRSTLIALMALATCNCEHWIKIKNPAYSRTRDVLAISSEYLVLARAGQRSSVLTGLG